MKNTVPELEAELTRVRKWIDDLQSGMYINCVYCGHRYGPKDKVPTSMADALKLHISQCPEHPMHSVLTVLKAGRDLISSAYSHVSHGGPSRQDAKQWIDTANDAIDKAEFVQPKPAKKRAEKKR